MMTLGSRRPLTLFALAALALAACDSPSQGVGGLVDVALEVADDPDGAGGEVSDDASDDATDASDDALDASDDALDASDDALDASDDAPDTSDDAPDIDSPPVACASDADCASTPGQPLCAAALGLCVACLQASDCPDPADCIAQQCVPHQACVNSLDCPGLQVCADGRCADCEADADCSEGAMCASGTCYPATPCDSDKDCTPQGQLCDKSKGICSQCTADPDCPPAYHCAEPAPGAPLACLVDVCVPGQMKCSGSDLATCIENGAGFETTACLDGESCAPSADGAACVQWVCPPGAHCQGDSAVTCSEDGLTVLDTVDCVAADKVCVAGACFEKENLEDGYPAAGLLVRITAPGQGRPSATVGQPEVVLSGLLFGQADSLAWHIEGGDEGDITPKTFWHSEPIALASGDNVVTVTATQGDVVTTDTVTITYNPGLPPNLTLRVRPGFLWKSEPTQLIATLEVPSVDALQPTGITLVELAPDGGSIDLGPMVDSGATSAYGDEVAGDRILSHKTSVTCAGQGQWYRARLAVTEPEPFAAWSEPVFVPCLERFNPLTCQSRKAALTEAQGLAASGQDVDSILAALEQHPSVAQAGLAEGPGHSLWVRFDDGILGAVLLAPTGLRGGSGADSLPASPGFAPAAIEAQPVVGARDALVLAPFLSQFEGTDDGPAVAEALSNSQCPHYSVEAGDVLWGPMATLERFRALSRYGVVSISTHGEALFGDLMPQAKAALGWRHQGAQEVLWSGEPIACDALQTAPKSCTVTAADPTGGCPSKTRCVTVLGSGGGSASGYCEDRTQADLRLGRVVLTNRGFAMTPAFFEHYAEAGLPNSLINLGACRTFHNGTLASALIARGAAAVTGFSDYVDSAWARDRVVALFEALLSGVPLLDAHTGGADPAHPASKWRSLAATDLDLSYPGLINGGFESGRTDAWRTEGDSRVVSGLSGSSPPEGGFMGLVSTGLGLTVQSGSLEQDVCIPEDVTTLTLTWKFLSEEFKEFCGSSFQDKFHVALNDPEGEQVVVVEVKVDDLCGPTDGSCGACPNPTACDLACVGTSACSLDDTGTSCEGTYPCNCGRFHQGLTPSAAKFDVGGVFETPWITTTHDVSALAGQGPFTLRIFASDTGDSIYDTVILVDDVRIE